MIDVIRKSKMNQPVGDYNTWFKRVWSSWWSWCFATI